jgi:hypothetical protein
MKKLDFFLYSLDRFSRINFLFLITEKKLGDGKVLFISNNKSFLATDTKLKLFLCFFKKKLFFFLPMAIYNIGLFMLEDILNTLSETFVERG